MDNALRELQDRQAIYEVVLRYCRGVDRLDMALVRSAYHHDGVDHHTGFDGPIDGYLTWVERALRTLDGTMHRIGNHFAEIDGDRAAVETYGTANHWGSPADDPSRNFSTGFRYVDWMERRDGRWGIVERFAVREWTYSDVGRPLPVDHPNAAAHRDTNDPIYRFRGRLSSPG